MTLFRSQDAAREHLEFGARAQRCQVEVKVFAECLPHARVIEEPILLKLSQQRDRFGGMRRSLLAARSRGPSFVSAPTARAARAYAQAAL